MSGSAPETTASSSDRMLALAGPGLLAPTAVLEIEVRQLLWWRLRALAVLGLLGAIAQAILLLFAQETHLPAPETSLGLLLLGLISLGVAAVLNHYREMSLRLLRAIEMGLVIALAAGSTYGRWINLAEVNQYTDPLQQELYVSAAGLRSNVTWVLLIVAYGLLIPNPWWRCVAVVGGLVGVVLVSTLLIGLLVEGVRPHLLGLLTATALSMSVSAFLAVFGSFKISTLQREAVAARRLGPYQIHRRLGSGGMGEVYLAEHRLLKRPCAIKLIRPDQAGDPTLLERFEREVRATAQLTHPNTVEIFDFGRTPDGTFYYVMEYLEGISLEELVRRWGPVSPGRAVHFLRQLCGPLREAHGLGLVHRDIKPGNVMACKLGGTHDVAKLLDFGLVRNLRERGGEQNLTQAGFVVGTPEYMAPEQARGLGVDGRSDLYALGGLAYYLLSGRPPFHGVSVLDTMMAHQQDTVRPISDWRSDVPDDFSAIIYRCLAKSPGERYTDARSLEQALANCSCAGQWTDADAEAWWQTVAARPADPSASVITLSLAAAQLSGPETT